MLIVDLPYEEEDFRKETKKTGLSLIPLIAPTTPEMRVKRILKNAEGFVYYIMVKGATGARGRLASDLGRNISVLRKNTALPIAVGFGISNASQACRCRECAHPGRT